MKQAPNPQTDAKAGGLRILLVEHDATTRRFLCDAMERAGYQVAVAADRSAMHEQLALATPSAVVIDLDALRSEGNDLIAEIGELSTRLLVVATTREPADPDLVTATRSQSRLTILGKPLTLAHLIAALDESLSPPSDAASAHALPAPDFDTATNPALRRALKLAHRAAATPAPILLVGERGVGKRRLAEQIHRWGRESRGTFLAIDCATAGGEFQDRALFAGAWGAPAAAPRATEGTTFYLDGVHTLASRHQAELYEFMAREQGAAAGAGPLPSAVSRFLTSSTADLEQLVARGSFRADLYYAVSVVTVSLPPLRQRTEDIAHLAQHFLTTHASRLGRVGCALTPAVLDRFLHHPWPGNIWELENVIERTLVATSGAEIDVYDLPTEFLKPTTS